MRPICSLSTEKKKTSNQKRHEFDDLNSVEQRVKEQEVKMPQFEIMPMVPQANKSWITNNNKNEATRVRKNVIEKRWNNENTYKKWHVVERQQWWWRRRGNVVDAHFGFRIISHFIFRQKAENICLLSETPSKRDEIKQLQETTDNLEHVDVAERELTIFSASYAASNRMHESRDPRKQQKKN